MLKQAKLENQHPGIYVLHSGDLIQLPPVLDFALYSETGGTKVQCEGRMLHKMYVISICLSVSMRKKVDENDEFRTELESLATG